MALLGAESFLSTLAPHFSLSGLHSPRRGNGRRAVAWLSIKPNALLLISSSGLTIRTRSSPAEKKEDTRLLSDFASSAIASISSGTQSISIYFVVLPPPPSSLLPASHAIPPFHHHSRFWGACLASSTILSLCLDPACQSIALLLGWLRHPCPLLPSPTFPST